VIGSRRFGGMLMAILEVIDHLDVLIAAVGFHDMTVVAIHDVVVVGSTD